MAFSMGCSMEDKDRWHVLYHDGITHVDEADTKEDGQGIGWADVDHDQVALIQLYEGDQVVASVLIPSGASPVLFRRRQIAIMANPEHTDELPQETGRTTVTVIGYTMPDGCASWLWRTPEGVVAMTAGEIHVAALPEGESQD